MDVVIFILQLVTTDISGDMIDITFVLGSGGRCEDVMWAKVGRMKNIIHIIFKFVFMTCAYILIKFTIRYL